MKKFLLSILLFSSFAVYAGEYKLSKGWPTGIHERFYTLPNEKYENCKKIGDALHLINTETSPLTCGLDIHGKDIILPAWSELDTGLVNKVLPLFQYFNSENSKIESATVPFPQVEKSILIRVSQNTCNDTSKDKIYTKFVYLKNNEPHKAIGLGDPFDVFVFNGKTYLVSYSRLNWDDSFQKRIVPPQKIIFIHSLFQRNKYANLGFVRECRFIYEN